MKDIFHSCSSSHPSSIILHRFDPDTGQVITGGLSGVPIDSGARSGPGQFLPRVGIAFRYNDKTVIRGGYGQSADPRPFQDVRNAFPIANIWDMPAIVFNGTSNPFIPVTTLRLGLINNSTPPDINAGIIPLASNASTTTYPATPMRKEIHSFNVFIERQLPGKFVGQVGYVGTRAVGQMGFININAGPPGTGNNGRPLFIRFGLTGNINSIMPYGTTTYDALQAMFARRWGSSLFGTSYTWSKTINFADNADGPRIQFMPEKQRNRGPAGYDRTHNSQTYLVYDLPFGKGQRWAQDGWVSKLLGGFQVSGAMSITSGLPFYVIQGSGFNLNAAGSGQVPDQVKADVAILGGIGQGNPYFDRSAYAVVNVPAGQPQRFGTAGRNNLPILPSFPRSPASDSKFLGQALSRNIQTRVCSNN